MPQLRSVISETLSNFNSSRGELATVPPSPAEIPDLCTKVDLALAANRDLLDAEGLGKPLLDYVRFVRAAVNAEIGEAFKAHCRTVLAKHGITDRATFIEKGPDWLMRTELPPYGKGRAFSGLIFGETLGTVTLNHLIEISDILGFPDLSTDTKQKCLDILAAQGITDRATLFAQGPTGFMKTDFPPYGKGQAFVGLILGETLRSVTVDHLLHLADALSLPDLSDKTRLRCLATLATHGIADRETLIAFTADKFKRASFPPFGKGFRLARFILTEAAKPLTPDHLGRIADKLGWPEKSKEEKLQAYRAVLSKHGIVDRLTLLAKGVVWFIRSDFFPYGKGGAFANLILGEVVNNFSFSRLTRIADKLGWPEADPKEKLQAYRSALAIHGVIDRNSLLANGSHWFEKADYPPYGKGLSFAGLILGGSVEKVTIDNLRHIAEILGLPDLADETKRKIRDAFTVHGITNRAELLSKGPKWFTRTDFLSYGKGNAFASLILGETITGLNIACLQRIAGILGWPEPSESERLQSYSSSLANQGMTDRISLLSFGVTEFREADFPPYGKGTAFAGEILGDSGLRVTLTHLRLIADILFPESK